MKKPAVAGILARGSPGFGLADAGLAAASTFLLGAAAVRVLDTTGLAAYSAMFAALILCAILPTQLVYVPTRLSANLQSGPAGEPLSTDLRLDLVRSAPVLLATAVLTCILSLPLAIHLPPEELAGALGGIFLLAASSPFQSHGRAVLHLVQQHRAAATTSLITLLVQIGLTLVLLAAADAVGLDSLSLGLLLASCALGNTAGGAFTMWRLRSWPRATGAGAGLSTRISFLLNDAVTQLAAYAAILICAAILGRAAVADLEAARVLASPVQVLVVGLMSFASPRAIRVLGSATPARYRRVQSGILLYVLTITVAYIGLVLLAGAQLDRLLHRSADPVLTAARAAVIAAYSTGSLPLTALLALKRVLPANLIVFITSALWIALLPGLLLLFGTYGLPAAQGIGAVSKTLSANIRLGRDLRASRPAQ